ncbi:MAG: hypothetical protein IT385_18935 [Deltaproteobacteria bacterium]|nr:hypothetical protein [Deltaproteobacteria bacterium]
MTELVTQSEFAKRVGISPGRVSQLISEKRIPREPNGKIDVAKATAAYQAMHVRVQGGEVRGGGRAIAGEGSAPKVGSEVLEHEVRKRKAEADLKEAQAAKVRGELVSRAKVERLLEEATTMVRVQVSSLEARLATQLVMQDLATIRSRLAAESQRILTEWRAILGGS